MPEQQQPQQPMVPPPGGVNTGVAAVSPATGTGGRGPGGAEVGVIGSFGLALYLVLFTIFVIYGLYKVWPYPTPSGQNPPNASASPSPAASPSVTPSPSGGPSSNQGTTSPASGTVAATTQTSVQTPTATPSPSPSPTVQPQFVSILGSTFEVSDEQRLMLLVILCGALGTLVHSLRSVYWYLGNRNLVQSWTAMYFMLPFTGAALALVFYLVIRGGFFSPQSGFSQTSPFGFAAFAALIGMFSSQAVLKLKEVAEVLLSKPLGGVDSRPQGLANPATAPLPPPAAPTQTPPTTTAPTPDPEDAESHIDGCEVEVENATRDEELPITEGGVG